MYVRRIKIESVRGLGAKREGVDLDLARPDGRYAGWTVLAGRNGTGKTTLLRAVALSLLGPLAARTLQDSFEGWIRHGEREAHVKTEIDYDEADLFPAPVRGRSVLLDPTSDNWREGSSVQPGSALQRKRCFRVDSTAWRLAREELRAGWARVGGHAGAAGGSRFVHAPMAGDRGRVRHDRITCGRSGGR